MAEQGDNSVTTCPGNTKGDNCGISKEDASEDNCYFESYADLHVHELMLKDRSRTLAYKNFIEKNKDVFEDKIVLDVGAGTGILSLFAAKAGAKKVYAIEASEIASACETIVNHNSYENVITVVHKKVEDVVLPPGEKADILISEWMGFYLLHESMIDSVIFARDNLLRENGSVFPSKAVMYLCPVNRDAEYREKFEFWKDVYGFDYSPLIPSAIVISLQAPSIECVHADSLLGDPKKVIEFDLHSVTLQQVQSFERALSFPVESDIKVHGFATWFDVEFEGLLANDLLSTSPKCTPTHWKQTIVNLPAPLLADKGDVIKCRLDLAQSASNKRHYNITLDLIGVPDIGEITNEQTDNGVVQYGENQNEESVSDSDSESEDHPTPCDCDAPRCRIIKALMEKYDEQDEMMESEGVVAITQEELDKAVDISDSIVDISNSLDS